MKTYDQQTKTGLRSPSHNPEIDVALAAIEKHRRPGETFSLAFIGEVAGVDRKTIHYISSKALQKVAREIHRIQMIEEL